MALSHKVIQLRQLINPESDGLIKFHGSLINVNE